MEGNEKRLPTWSETPARAWLQEFLDGAFPDASGKVSADLHFAVAMCRAEPKLAQVALQLLAQEVRAGKAPPDGVEFLRFALGVLFMAYCAWARSEGRAGESGIPPELDQAVRRNPEIIECANGIGPIEEVLPSGN